MKLFLDTADVAVIKDMVPTGMVDGVTTNPSLIAKSGRNIAEVIAEICALVEGPISAEAVATDFETMVRTASRPAAHPDLPAAAAPTPEVIEMLVRICADNQIEIVGPPLA